MALKTGLAGAALMALAAAGCASAPGGAGPASVEAAGGETARGSRQRLRADVAWLADDAREGREAGTPGFDAAADYVAGRMAEIGLSPGGDNGTYMQDVPLLAYSQDSNGGGTLEVRGVPEPGAFTRGESYMVGASSFGEDVIVDEEVVFAGFGFVSPAHGRDDYAGLDVDGKIVALLPGAPKFLNSEERAHYGNTQRDRASARGAVGIITLTTPDRERVRSWESRVEQAAASRSVSMRWLEDGGQAFTTYGNIQAAASMGDEGAAALFAGQEMEWAEISALADSEQGDVPGFALDGVTARIAIESRHQRIDSHNVIGLVEGSDPELKGEYVVLTAHLDHVGVRRSVLEDDDQIFNGAMDNASGIASMLEAARVLAANPPRRSVMFIALTAEEKGLIGSDYFARDPTVAKEAVVANINLDMPIVTYEFTDLIAFGAERSTMFGAVEAAANARGLALSPDPQPEQNFFTRSDHYSFVKQGVPSIFVRPGFANGGEEAQNTFRLKHYHRVSDEIDLVDFGALAAFTEVNAQIARNVADMDERPVWVKGDFFGTTFNGLMAE